MPRNTPTRITRPRLLARAARAGMAFYRRERDLAGALPGGATGRGLIVALSTAEAACDADRRANAPTYSVTRHVRLLTALLAEARRGVAA